MRFKGLTDQKRLRFRATVGRFGTKPGWRGARPVPTILLKDISCITEGVTGTTDHLWFTCGVWSECLRDGDVFEFDARLGQYEKGYVNYRRGIDERETDQKLNRPTRVAFANRPEQGVQNQGEYDAHATRI